MTQKNLVNTSIVFFILTINIWNFYIRKETWCHSSSVYRTNLVEIYINSELICNLQPDYDDIEEDVRIQPYPVSRGSHNTDKGKNNKKYGKMKCHVTIIKYNTQIKKVVTLTPKSSKKIIMGIIHQTKSKNTIKYKSQTSILVTIG